MNYAKSQPDMAIMAVNTFVKDCEVRLGIILVYSLSKADLKIIYILHAPTPALFLYG
jgi:hypothetical protein